MLIWSLLGCQEPPTASLEGARRSLDNASKAGAGRYAADEYQRATDLLIQGNMELARQNGRLSPFRDFTAADSLFTLASSTAREAQEQARSQHRDLRDRSVGCRDNLRNELRAWREAMETSLLKNRSRPYLERASLSLDLGQQLMDGEKFDESIRLFEEGTKSLADLGYIMDEYAGEENRKIDTWRKWVEETIKRSRSEGSSAIVVDKSVHKLYLVYRGRLIHSYECELGYKPARPKLFAGDGATPEGTYRVVNIKNKGSKFYKAILIDYPNDLDRRRYRENREKGVVSSRTGIGAFIEIHGEGGRKQDWTNGCVALTNRDMDHLIQNVSVGTPVTIVRKSDRWP